MGSVRPAYSTFGRYTGQAWKTYPAVMGNFRLRTSHSRALTRAIRRTRGRCGAAFVAKRRIVFTDICSAPKAVTLWAKRGDVAGARLDRLPS